MKAIDIRSIHRHPGESRDPLNWCNNCSAAGMERLQWIPAFAGMTDSERAVDDSCPYDCEYE